MKGSTLQIVDPMHNSLHPGLYTQNAELYFAEPYIQGCILSESTQLNLIIQRRALNIQLYIECSRWISAFNAGLWESHLRWMLRALRCSALNDENLRALRWMMRFNETLSDTRRALNAEHSIYSRWISSFTAGLYIANCTFNEGLYIANCRFNAELPTSRALYSMGRSILQSSTFRALHSGNVEPYIGSTFIALIIRCRALRCKERWGAGVETQKNVRGEIGGWGRVPFNETYAPSLSTIYDGA